MTVIMKVRIEIDTQTFVRFWLVVFGFALVILLMYMARAALAIVGVSFFLALALNVPVARIAKWLPGKSRVGATALSYVAVVAILTAFIVLVIPPIIEQSIRFAETVPAMLDSATSRWGTLDDIINRYGVQEYVDQAVASVQANATSWAQNIGSTIISGAGSLFSVIAAMFMVFVLTFLMLVEGEAWINRIWGMYRDTARMRHHRELATKMYRVVTGYVTGQLGIAMIAATSSALAVFALSFFFDFPASLAFPTAALIFIGALIPMFGATIGGAIVGLLLAFDSITAAIIFLIFFIIYQQVENNIISPVVQSKTNNLSALMVLVAVTIGIYMFGLAGAVISIPIAGCAQVLLVDYLQRSKKRRDKKDTPSGRLVKKIQSEA